MVSNTVVDPVQYAIDSSLQVSIVLPVRGEVEHARRGLADLFASYYDCPIFSLLTKRQRRSYVRKWIAKTSTIINDMGFIEAVNYLAKLGSCFLNSFTYEGQALTYKHSELLDGLPYINGIGYVSKLLQEDRADEAINVAAWIYNACVLLSKIPLSRPDLKKRSKEAWIERQTQVKGKSEFRVDVLEAMRMATGYLYDYSHIDDHEGKHGPGSTALGDKTVPEKQIRFQHSVDTIQVTSYNPTAKELTEESEDALYIDVFKDLKSTRPITAEPVNMQFAQQKIKRSMYANIDNGYVMASNFIKFADQSRSRRLALEGSVFSTLDTRPITVDLSSASDLLSNELVSESFSPELYRLLKLCRSKRVRVGKKVVEVKMFAGMGSAVTFPVQTLIFTAISLLAVTRSLYIKQFGDTEVTYADALREYLGQDLRKQYDVAKYLRKICVYGDDIIIPDIGTAELFYLLEHLGLRVNHDKSFFGNSAVREACGIFALAGRDITPVRFRVPVWDTTADFAVFESLRQHVNNSFVSARLTQYRYRMRLYVGLIPHISRFERMRRFVTLTLGVRDGKKVCSYHRVGTPGPLYEEFRGDDVDYIGVISTRAVETDFGYVFGTIMRTLTAYAPETKTDPDELNDDYYYLQNRYIAIHADDGDQNSHGRIPRGIKLVKRIAHRRSDGLGWAWVPNQG